MSDMDLLPLEPLTADAFKPFGDVIETRGARHFPINGGRTERYHDLADIQFDGPGARPILSIFRCEPVSLPLRIEMLERHPRGSQAFMPLANRPYLVVVAAPGEDPETSGLRAFLARGDQGVNYHAGVWHHPLLPLESIADFLVVDRAGPGNNCDERPLRSPYQIRQER